MSNAAPAWPRSLKLGVHAVQTPAPGCSTTPTKVPTPLPPLDNLEENHIQLVTHPLYFWPWLSPMWLLCSLKWSSSWRGSSFRVSKMLEPYSRATSDMPPWMWSGAMVTWFQRPIKSCMLRGLLRKTRVGKKPICVLRSPHPDTYGVTLISCHHCGHIFFAFYL